MIVKGWHNFLILLSHNRIKYRVVYSGRDKKAGQDYVLNSTSGSLLREEEQEMSLTGDGYLGGGVVV